jgi:hypothetical protein
LALDEGMGVIFRYFPILIIFDLIFIFFFKLTVIVLVRVGVSVVDFECGL